MTASTDTRMNVLDTRLQARLFDARHEVKRLGDTVTEIATQIEDRMATVKRRVQTGESLNSLGELQAMGPALDVAVAKLLAGRSHYEALRAIAEAAGIPEFDF